MINCILLVLLLLVSMVLQKCTNSPLVIRLLNFVRWFRLQVLLIVIFVRFLCDLLSPLVLNDYSGKDTSFVSQIHNANLSIKCLVSYDVTSLFTNIPLQEIIDIAISLIFNHNANLNITREEFKKLFLFTKSEAHFIFNSKFYNQIDRVAMGSPFSPVLANICMSFHESKWLNEYNLNKRKFCVRYVDDILAAFDNEQDSLKFLNNRHPNIKFTIEKQSNHSIVFLNVLISGINNQNLTLQTSQIDEYRTSLKFQEFYIIFIYAQFNQMSDRQVV